MYFSKIEYTQEREKRHLIFEDTVFGPMHELFFELCYKYGLTPVIVCEFAGTPVENTSIMQRYYERLKSK